MRAMRRSSLSDVMAEAFSPISLRISVLSTNAITAMRLKSRSSARSIIASSNSITSASPPCNLKANARTASNSKVPKISLFLR